MTLIKRADSPFLVAIIAGATLAIMSKIVGWNLVGYVALPATTLFILGLAWRHRRRNKGSYANAITMALFLSIIADALLQFNEHNAIFFSAGLALFGLVQLIYAIAFWSGQKFYKKDILPLFVMIFFVSFMHLLLRPHFADHEGQNYLPILTYLILISFMGWRALATLYRPCFAPNQKVLIAAGALFFLASDTLLATSLFIKPLSFQPLWALSTYYIAQTLFALSVRRPKKHPKVTGKRGQV